MLPVSTVFGFVGFGLTVLQEAATVDAYLESMPGASIQGLSSEALMTRDGFENPVGVGGYLYLDFIPVVDLELDFQVSFATYAFNYSVNAAGTQLASTPDDAEFAYARGSAYLTVRKKLFGVGVPILGGVKLHAGGGLNFHQTAPYMSIGMMEDLLGDQMFEDFSADPEDMQDRMIEYVEDNLESATGFHVQAGVQLKLLVLDAFLNYRYTIAKDIYPDSNGFGALNLRLGIGF